MFISLSTSFCFPLFHCSLRSPRTTTHEPSSSPTPICFAPFIGVCICILFVVSWIVSGSCALVLSRPPSAHCFASKRSRVFYIADFFDAFPSPSADPADRDGCPKIVNLGAAKTDLFYERKVGWAPPRSQAQTLTLSNRAGVWTRNRRCIACVCACARALFSCSDLVGSELCGLTAELVFFRDTVFLLCLLIGRTNLFLLLMFFSVPVVCFVAKFSNVGFPGWSFFFRPLSMTLVCSVILTFGPCIFSFCACFPLPCIFSFNIHPSDTTP